VSFIRGGETVTIKRRSQTSRDEFGNASYSTTTINVKNALVAIGTTSEEVDVQRDATDASVTLYLPRGIEVHDGDVFIIRGTQWQRDGGAQEWISPFPAIEGGIIVPLRKRRG
jgi:hypothetical protein